MVDDEVVELVDCDVAGLLINECRDLISRL